MPTNKKILIIEDDIALYNVYAAALKLKGYEVINVADGALALTRIREVMPELILLDIMLPNKNGLDVLQEMRGIEELKNIRVVLLTNFGNEANVTRAIELGAEDCLMKYNIVPTELSEKIVALLGDAESSDVKLMSA